MRILVDSVQCNNLSNSNTCFSEIIRSSAIPSRVACSTIIACSTVHGDVERAGVSINDSYIFSIGIAIVVVGFTLAFGALAERLLMAEGES